MCVSCIKRNMILNENIPSPELKELKTRKSAVIPSIFINDLRTDMKGISGLKDNSNEEQQEYHQLWQLQQQQQQQQQQVAQLRKLNLISEVEKNSEGKVDHITSRGLFTITSRLHIPHSSEFSDFKKMKRSFSFGGFGVFSKSEPSLSAFTREEIELMIDPVSKKEPSKTSKKQIKEYASKYKNYQDDGLKKTPWYRDPLEYTQPAHLITCIAFVYLAFRLFPDSRRGSTGASTLTRLLYVSSISTVFGAQFWMTFVSGLALFFSIPRHMFAKVQAVLFPLYFLINATLLLIAIVTYTQHNPTHLWNNHQLMQGGILVSAFVINLGIRLYLAPVLVKLITIKIAIESEAGLGNEVGSNSPGLLSKCPHYMRLYKAFRRMHIIIAIGNMISMAGTCFHLYYLATMICS